MSLHLYFYANLMEIPCHLFCVWHIWNQCFDHNCPQILCQIPVLSRQCIHTYIWAHRWICWADILQNVFWKLGQCRQVFPSLSWSLTSLSKGGNLKRTEISLCSLSLFLNCASCVVVHRQMGRSAVSLFLDFLPFLFQKLDVKWHICDDE